MVSKLDCRLTDRRFAPVSTLKLTTMTSHPVVHHWVIKGLSMFSCVCATGHTQDPLSCKSRASMSRWPVFF